MGEVNGSRYAIVMNLTEKKLSLISEMDSLEHNFKIAKQKAITAQKNIKADQEAIYREAQEHIRVLQKEISDIELEADKKCERILRDVEQRIFEAENMEDNMKFKVESYKKQIAAVDDALNKIESVSANSVPDSRM